MSKPSEAKEILNFKIGVSGTFWDKRPAYAILIDGAEQVSAIIKGASGETELHEFSLELKEDCDHVLEIRLINKTDQDVVETEDKTAIVKDLLLNIESIEIDDINIGSLKWSLSEFVADDPARPTLKNCVNLGWNGSYKLKFSSPFYLWLLENM